MSVSSEENYFCHTCKNSRDITPEWKCATCNSSFIEQRESISVPQPLPSLPQPAPPPVDQRFPGTSDISQFHQAPTNFYNESLTQTSVPVRPVFIRQPQRRPQRLPDHNRQTFRRRRLGPRVRPSRSFNRGRPSLLVDSEGNLIQSSNNDGFQLEEDESSSLFNIWQRINGRNRIMNVNPNDIAWTQEGLDSILVRLREEAEHVGAAEQTAPPRAFPHLVETTELPSDHQSCCICMSDFEEGETFIHLPCKHVFHADEIRNWLQLNTQCPVCRTDAV